MKQESSPIKYFLYARKSSESDDRQIQSIDDQVERLKQLATDLNLDVKKTYTESKSAKKPNNRPGFDEMIQRIENGEANGILCWHINRLFRNPIDQGRISWLLQKGILKSIKTTEKEYLPEDNVLILGVEGGVANQFIIDLSKATKRGISRKVKNGWRPSRAPLGYINDKFGEKGNKKVLKDPERFPLVRKMWDMVLTGDYCISQIRRMANEEWGLRTLPLKRLGNRKLCMSCVYKILTNPFYYGEFIYDGETYQGAHEPMITKEEFDRVQKLLGRAGRPRPQHKRLPFCGIIRCGECGCSFTSYEKIKKIKSTGKLKGYIYFKCTKRKDNVVCHQEQIKYEDLKEQIEKYLDSITIPEEFLHWAIKVLNENNELEKTDRNLILQTQQKNYQECVKRIDNLIQLYISPENSNKELLSEEEFKNQKNTLLSEKLKIEGEIKRTGERVNEWLELSEKTFNFATYARYWFEKGDYEAKTGILRALGQNFVLEGGTLRIDLKKPFLVVKEGLESMGLEKGRFELAEMAKTGLKNGKNSRLATVFSRWGGQRELNP